MSTALARRRANEALQRERLEYVGDIEKTHLVNQTEANGRKRMTREEIRSRARDSSLDLLRSLERKRDQLKKLYSSEMQQWKAVKKERQKAKKADRFIEMRAKAYQLSEAREEKRRQYVEEKNEQRKGIMADTDARAKLKISKLDMGQQGFRKNKQVSPNHSSRSEDMGWPSVQSGVPPLPVVEKQTNHMDLKRGLDLQLAIKRQEAELAMEQIQREEAKQLEQWKKNEKEAQLNKEIVLRENQARGEEVLQDNASRFELRKAQLEEEKRGDEVLLQYALANERQAIEEEQKLKKANQGNAREYRSYIQSQMIKSKADTSKADALRDAKIAESWARRDMEIKAEAEARRRLALEVELTRKSQIKERNERIEKSKQELRDFVLQQALQ